MFSGVIIRILACVSEAICGGFVTSKRDIYYQDALYFGSQKTVDRCVDEIACTLGVDRMALHVVRSTKLPLRLLPVNLTVHGRWQQQRA